MNPESECALETEINRVLQGLPNLAAPPGLLTRTMNALEQPAPWHKQSWVQWPLPVRATLFVMGLTVLAAAVVGWRVGEPDLMAAVYHWLTPVVAGVKSFWNVLGALADAAALAVEYLGNGFMLACLAAAAGMCAVCAGLGTILVRFASAEPERNQ